MLAGVLGIRVSVEVNPRCAQDLRIGFATRSPIVSKTQAPASEAEKTEWLFWCARLADVVVLSAVLRFRPPTAEDVAAEIFAHVQGLHGPLLSHLEELLEGCVNSAVGQFVVLVGR